MRGLLIVTICLTYQWTAAQVVSVKGVVLDKNQDPIPYMNIGIIDKNLGTISDVNGEFELSVSDKYLNNVLSFSAIGYVTRSFKITDLIQQEHLSIQFEDKVVALDEVVISAKPAKKRFVKLGVTSVGSGKSKMHCQVIELVRGAKIAHLIEPDRFPVGLSKARMNISPFSASPRWIRVRVYEVDSLSNKPGLEITGKNLIVDIEGKKDWIEVDLEELNLTVNQNFFISFEFLDFKKMLLMMPCHEESKYPNKQFIQEVSFGEWKRSESLPDQVFTIGAEVFYYKR